MAATETRNGVVKKELTTPEPCDKADIKRVISEFQAIRESLDGIVDKLKSPEYSAIIEKELHDPKTLPNAELYWISSAVVDSLDHLQSMLTQSADFVGEIFFSSFGAAALMTVVEASIPDLLEDGPLSAADLAEKCGLQRERVSQLLDILVHMNIFSYDLPSRKYANNRASLLLCKNHGDQWRGWSKILVSSFFETGWFVPQAIKAGEQRSAWQIKHGMSSEMDLWKNIDVIGKDLDFYGMLATNGASQLRGLLANDYPWDEISSESVTDIGCGTGDFLASLLRRNPGMTGELLDRPPVIDMITPTFRNADGKNADIGQRIRQLHAGNFLEYVPPSAVYTIKMCLHNWKDEDVVKILNNIRRSIIERPNSRLILIDAVKHAGRSSRLAYYSDLIMMATVNGQERSAAEWTLLAARGGWRIQQIYGLRQAWSSALDLRPV